MIYSNGTGLYDYGFQPQYTYATTQTAFQITDLTLNGQTFKAEEPTRVPDAPATAVDWLRARVQETCDAAFADIAA